MQVIQDGRTHTFCGTIDYFSPELLNGCGYGISVDWWACGVLLYEMLVGAAPFSEKEEERTYERIKACDLHIPTSVAYEGADLIRGLLQPEVSLRLGCGGAGFVAFEEHAFFSGLSVDEPGGMGTRWPKQLLARQLEAPWKPELRSNMDTQYFEPVDVGRTPWTDAGWAPDATAADYNSDGNIVQVVDAFSDF